MIAPSRLAADSKAELKFRIREELNEASLEAIAVASVIAADDLAKRLGVDRETAVMARKAAKRHVRELWAFEESAWERKA
jgi:hypothetical protein